MEAKKEKIEKLVNDMLTDCLEIMKQDIKKTLNSCSLDIENWDEKNNKMIIPKSILIAVLEKNANQYKATGTSFEKEVKKNVKNLSYYI